MTLKDNVPRKTIMAGLAGKEVEIFERSFQKSGMRSEAEFLRYLIAQFDRMTEMKG